MRHATPLVLKIFHSELAQFLAPECVIEQGGQNGPVPHALHGVFVRGREQLARLRITKGRSFTFFAFVLRALHALDRIVGHGVPVAEILKQRGQRCQPVPDGRTAQDPICKIIAPGDHMRARHRPEFFRSLDAGKQHEILDRIFIGATGAGVADVCEPLDLGRDISEPLELGGG